MTVSSLSIEGVFLLHDKVFLDERGAFTEIWEERELSRSGILFKPGSSCFSYNLRSGILRGLHYQLEPHGQSKIVTCIYGEAYDVILDLRKSSSSYLKWEAVSLTAFSGQAIYIPRGCAHGFVTRKAHTVISYLIEGDYVPSSLGVVRWNDPAVGIKWPVDEPILSEKDRSAPDFVT